MRTVNRTIALLAVVLAGTSISVQARIDNEHANLYASYADWTLVSDSDTTDCHESYVVEYEYDFVPVLKCQFLHTGIVTYSLPLFADIDGDGETEVVVTLEHLPDGFAVINPNTCEVEHLVNVQGDVSIKDGGTALGDVDHNGFVDVFIEVSSRIQRWEYDPGSNKMLMRWQTEPNVSVADRTHLDILDLNQDGQPELIPNQGRMVNAVTGYVYPGELPLLHTEAKGLFAFTADADPGQAPAGQGNVELIYGTHMYRYDFTNEAWVLVKEHPIVDWGYVANVSLADMDLDGDIDAVMSNWDETGQALIWDMQTDELLGGGIFDYPGSYGSRINISNMDEDDYPEMVMTCVFKILAIDDIVTNQGFNQVLWLDQTSDESGHTQITSFDFDGNGTYEIIYRDETRMRIFSGLGTGEPTNGYPSGPLVLLDSGDIELCESYTGMEYPTIGDIDNDDQAEIVATCRGALNIYESGSLPWGNASKVWNTQAYNVTCVNQDGTIPAVMTENYTVYNNFLAQINTNPESDTLFVSLPDAIIQLEDLQNDCEGNVAIEFEVCNQGATELPAGMPVSIYWKNPTMVEAELIATLHLPFMLDAGNCYTFTSSFFAAPATPVEIYTVVNDDGQQQLPYLLDDQDNGGNFPVTGIKECDYTNNLADSIYQVGSHEEVNLEAEICEGEVYEFGEEELTESGTYQTTHINTSGCDSTVTLTLNVLETSETTLEAEICAGEVYEFGESQLTESGTYQTSHVNTSGCDSIVTLTLNVLDASETILEAEICEGEVYEFGESQLTESGTYQTSHINTSGCDSTVTLTLNVLEASETTLEAEICEGEVYEFGEEELTESGVYQTSHINTSGCDSTVTLTLNVLETSETTLEAEICAGEVYEFGESQLTASGTYQTSHINTSGCDSTVTLTLNVLENSSYSFNTHICEGETFTFQNQVMDQAGTYEFNLTAVNGCDSLVTMNLIINPLEHTSIEAEICAGEAYEFGESQLTESGVYQTSHINTSGCDSTVTLTLNVLENSSYSFNTHICEGETFTFQNQVMDQAGTYEFNLTAVNGCDSLVTMNLIINPLEHTSIEAEICAGEAYEFGESQLTESGVYQTSHINTSGCDSTVTLTLNVLEATETTLEAEICEGEVYEFGEEELTESGTYQTTHINTSGCDSTVTLTLNVLAATETTLEAEICAGEVYEFGEEELTESGTYQTTHINTSGCDSTVTLTLNVLEATETTLEAEICEGEVYEFGEEELTESGTYQTTHINTSGCDSTVTLTLNVLEATETTLEAEICAGEVYEFGESQLTASGTYQTSYINTSGCDSTVRLTLQVLEPGINELETTICEGNSYELNGEIFTEAGHYTRKLTAANGCDSIIYLTLNTLPDQHKNIDKTICRGDTLAFGSLLLTEPGDYHQLFLSSFGCDSTVTLKLQVIEPAIAEWEKAICEGEVFELNGTSYTEKGQYQQILTSTNGCDSIIRINLDVHPIDETQLEVNICEGEVYEFGESQLTASGVYQTSYINANGCDSLVYLKLQVVQNIEQSLEAEICAGEVYEFGEEELTESGVYQTSHINISGCDSTVTLTLNVLEEVETYLNAELCEGEVYEFGESQLTESGTYQTSYINNNGCDSIVTLQLEVIPSVELFGADVSICEGEEVDLEVYGSENVQWFPATGLSCSNCPNPVASPSETTIYLVQTEGCGGTVVETEIMVEVLEKPTLQTNEGRTITPGEEVELEAQGTWGMGAVNWEGPEGLICQDCPRITVLPQGNSIYEASVMNDEGCLASDTVHIQVRLDCIEGDFFIPNAFSPNGDGTNESFHITAYTDAQLEYLRIYDRWGELMFETNDFNQVWDGRFRGKLLNPGVYVYYMRVKCPDEESYERFGNVTLIR